MGAGEGLPVRPGGGAGAGKVGAGTIGAAEGLRVGCGQGGHPQVSVLTCPACGATPRGRSGPCLWVSVGGRAIADPAPVGHTSWVCRSDVAGWAGTAP